jgi:signal peptidase I
VSRRLIIIGFVCCALALLIPPLGVISLVVGILALVSGRVAAGVALVLLSIVLPFAGTLILEEFFVKPYRIPSEAMVPTLPVGDRLLVWRASVDPQRGDIAVFNPPAGAESDQQCGARPHEGQACSKPTAEKAEVNFIKRIVAGPGDRVAIRAGHVILNGTRQPEPYIAEACGGTPGCDLPTPITIPPDHYFMMGDNRGASDDSRFWGPVPRDWITGRAFYRYWPRGRIGSL